MEIIDDKSKTFQKAGKELVEETHGVHKESEENKGLINTTSEGDKNEKTEKEREVKTNDAPERETEFKANGKPEHEPELKNESGEDAKNTSEFKADGDISVPTASTSVTGECSGTTIKFQKSSSTRNYRKHALEDASINSDTDEEENKSVSAEKKLKTSDEVETNGSPSVNAATETDSDEEEYARRDGMTLERSSSSSPTAMHSNDEDEDDDDEEDQNSSDDDSFGLSFIGTGRRRLLQSYNEPTDEEMPLPKVLTKEKPKHKWSITREIMNRQYGASSHMNTPYKLHTKYYGSLHAVQRLELMYKLNEHNGCVNSLNFNESGNKLVSGSDDTKVVVWDWTIGKKILKFATGHRNNIFQSKFMRYTNDTEIITCARDGQVRLHTLLINKYI